MPGQNTGHFADQFMAVLLATAFLLTELYSRALDNSLSETLKFHIETLVDRTLINRDARSEAIRLGDPRFERPASGWYWVIRDEAGQTLNFSGSMVGMLLGTVLLVGALSFMPAVVLGPVADHLIAVES